MFNTESNVMKQTNRKLVMTEWQNTHQWRERERERERNHDWQR